MISKKELLKIDKALEKFIEVAKPIVSRIGASKDSADCLVLSGWGDAQKGANKINKAFIAFEKSGA